MSREEQMENLRHQLSVARSEIQNLRQQVRALGCNQQKDVARIQNLLSSWHCSNCQQQATPEENNSSLTLRPIGVISTWFPEKKGTPRQPGICVNSRGKLTLFNTVFTNPEHALEGLEEFSHMWILFYFHKNDSTNVKAKVSPPRLNGVRMGVFGTRSPHRPSPIGLSLVSIDRVEDSSVYFSGVDMVDGTPVLDIKPYIPQYDSPLHCESRDVSISAEPGLRLMEGQEAEAVPGTSRQGGDPGAGAAAAAAAAAAASSFAESMERMSLRPDERMGEREAPDGEEGSHAASNSLSAPQNNESRPPVVRVPAWIAQPPLSKLTVSFSDRARAQLESITSGTDSADSVLNAIKSVLREDPRSVYLRERWGNQFYTFLICNLHVSCKFDDVMHSVTVFQVKSAAKQCECGQLEWQCSIHSESGN